MTQGPQKPQGARSPQGVTPIQMPAQMPHGMGNPASGSKKSTSFMETAVEWGFKILAFPSWIVTTIFHSMLQPGAGGATFMGRMTFIFLVVLSSDSIWQTVFRQKALLPWYAESWVGWGWVPGLEINFRPIHVGLSLGILADPLFYIAVTISMIIQLIESAVLFGERFFGVDRRVLGFAAIFCLVVEVIAGFATRNPLRYEDPGEVIKCTLYIVFSIAAPELGRWGEKILSAKK